MAASPDWKVYTDDGEYIASCKYPVDAAAIVNIHGDGTEVRLGHDIVCWVEGQEDQPAGNSYDNVSGTCYNRALVWDKAIHAALQGNGSAQRASQTRKFWNRAMRLGTDLVMYDVVCRLANNE